MAVVSGDIVQIYTTSQRVYVELDVPEEQRPLKGFFAMHTYSLPRDPRYSNLLMAASQGLPVEIRTRSPISPDEYGDIAVVAVRFDAP